MSINNEHDMPIWNPYSNKGCNFTCETQTACCVGGVSAPRRLGLIWQILDGTLAINLLDLSAERETGACVSSDFIIASTTVRFCLEK